MTTRKKPGNNEEEKKGSLFEKLLRSNRTDNRYARPIWFEFLVGLHSIRISNVYENTPFYRFMLKIQEHRTAVEREKNNFSLLKKYQFLQKKLNEASKENRKILE